MQIDIDGILNYQFKRMRRPQSAKPGHKGYWGSSSLEESNEVVQKDRRKQVKIVRPDLTTHDFARILPRKIQQDKERLYSEALHLKQVLNETSQENTRLKTKISILEREKEKMSKFVTSSDGIGKISRITAYQTKNNEKENLIVRNLKKIVREGRQQNDSLRIENQKIKKMMKYTKINELEIQKKIILDENKKIAQMLEDLNKNIIDQEQMQQQNLQMKKYIEEQIEDRENWEQERQKYEEIVQELQQKLKEEAQKHLNKEKKFNMDLNAERRKNQDLKRKNQQLLKQIKTLRQNQIFIQQKKSVTTSKPIQKNIRNNKNISGKVNTEQSEAVNQDKKMEYISAQNQRLIKQLELIKDKLKKAQSQLSLFQEKSRVINTSNLNIISHVEEKNIEGSQVNIEGKSLLQSDAQRNDELNQNEEYEESFEKEENDGIKKGQGQQQLQKYKKDFQQNEQQEQLYTKQEKKPTKIQKEEKKEKSNKKKGNKRQKTAKQHSILKKTHPIIHQIRQLLTYRMKSQRYPFTQIQKDIENAETKTFTYPDLCNMFINQPFYLSPTYAKALLNFVFEKQKIETNDSVDSSSLIVKLRQVIQDFQLMQQAQERQMIVRIAEMTSNYPRQLQIAFQNIRNGEQTVAQGDLKEMFQKLQLEDKYIELIIAELSLCSDDLEHLNFYGFFERFYLDEEEENVDFYGDAIEEQRQQSEESHRHSSRIKKINHKASSQQVRDSTKNLRP